MCVVIERAAGEGGSVREGSLLLARFSTQLLPMTDQSRRGSQGPWQTAGSLSEERVRWQQAPPDPWLLCQASLVSDGLKQGQTWLALNAARLSYKGICICHGVMKGETLGSGVGEVNDLCLSQYSVSPTV